VTRLHQEVQAQRHRGAVRLERRLTAALAVLTVLAVVSLSILWPLIGRA
jgi:uncharacterized protein YhdP